MKDILLGIQAVKIILIGISSEIRRDSPGIHEAVHRLIVWCASYRTGNNTTCI